jgi:hypothetical protein
MTDWNKILKAFNKPLLIITERRVSDDRIVKLMFLPSDETYQVYVGTALISTHNLREDGIEEYLRTVNRVVPKPAKKTRKVSTKKTSCPLVPESMGARPSRYTQN